MNATTILPSLGVLCVAVGMYIFGRLSGIHLTFEGRAMQFVAFVVALFGAWLVMWFPWRAWWTVRRSWRSAPPVPTSGLGCMADQKTNARGQTLEETLAEADRVVRELHRAQVAAVPELEHAENLGDWFFLECDGQIPEGTRAQWEEAFRRLYSFKDETGAVSDRLAVSRRGRDVQFINPKGISGVVVIPDDQVEAWIARARKVLQAAAIKPTA